VTEYFASRLFPDFFDQKWSLALWAGTIDGSIPDRKGASRIIAAGIKCLAFFCALLNQVSPAILGSAFDT
jgi:hypothetical protein